MYLGRVGGRVRLVLEGEDDGLVGSGMYLGRVRIGGDSVGVRGGL